MTTDAARECGSSWDSGADCPERKSTRHACDLDLEHDGSHECSCGKHSAFALSFAAPTDAAQVLTEAERRLIENYSRLLDIGGFGPEGTLASDTVDRLLRIIARLSASRPPAEGPEGQRPLTEEEIERYEEHAILLRRWSQAYPTDVFPVPPEDQRPIDSAAAYVMREMACPQFAKDADAIESLLARLIPPPPEQP